MRDLLILAFLPLALQSMRAQTPAAPQLDLTVGRSHVLEVAGGVERVSVASGDVLEAVAITANQVLLNGKAPGDTSVVVWPRGGAYMTYEVHVSPSPSKVERIRGELRREVGEGADVDVENETVFLRGSVKDLSDAERAAAIAASLGKTVNLLRVAVPPVQPEILLKIRFADVDRNASLELGANFFSTGAGNTTGAVTTGQFAAPQPTNITNNSSNGFSITNALNLFLFRPDLNLGATIQALQAKNLIQILAEPDLLAMDGKEASFLAGGEFPYPVVQGAGGTGLTTVTIQFREFGVRIKFVPTITPRGSIKLQVAPEVSALDYANGLSYQGFVVPGLDVRRVSTEIELENGQSFAIAGLLDNRVTDNLSKVPGLGNIPFFGRLFQSRSLSRTKSELLVVVTPQLVHPLPAGTTPPQVDMPKPFLKDGGTKTPEASTPDTNPPPARNSVPVEQMIEQKLIPATMSAPEPPLGMRGVQR